jgi:ABC-2 type transport system ATP-binding protein
VSNAIDIQSLSKIYPARGRPVVPSVDRLDLAIPRGQICGLLGPNGAGKTTTIKMICGLVTPTSGRALINGCDAHRQRSAAMRQIGAVLEGTRNVYWRLSAWQNLVYFGRLKGCTRREIEPRAEALLRDLELWTRKDNPVGQFSRGMQQKVAIASALIADPPIVLLDEPTLGLDVQAARIVKNWVVRLTREQGKTVIITSHELDMVQEVCERVAIMRQGRMVADRPVAELLGLFREDCYQIRVGGRIAQPVAAFDGLDCTPDEDGATLCGPIADQRALHAVLERVHDAGLTLVSVQRVEPRLEDVFVRLTQAE